MPSIKNHFKEDNISDKNKLKELSKLIIFYKKRNIFDKIIWTWENKKVLENQVSQ